MKYLCALGTTFEMIMKQFSSTILENNQIHVSWSISFVCRRKRDANNFVLKTRQRFILLLILELFLCHHSQQTNQFRAQKSWDKENVSSSVSTKLPLVERSIKIFILLFFILFQLLRTAVFLNVRSFDVITVTFLWKYLTSIYIWLYD